MSVFNVELKKVVDDSYDIEMGYRLEDQLVEDLETGLLGKIRKFAVITDSNVLDLYAKPISEKLSKAGFKVELFWLLQMHPWAERLPLIHRLQRI